MERNLFNKNRFKVKIFVKLMRIEEHEHELDWSEEEWNLFYDKIQLVLEKNKIKLERKARFLNEKVLV